MRYSSRLTVAAHILMCIGYFHGKEKLTSDFLAGSVNVNPVVVRNILGKLKKAGLVKVEAGIGGASLARDPADITLLDVFNAVETDTDLFHFHENPNPECPVGRSVHPVLGEQLAGVQSEMERQLESITLKDLMSGISE
ncbi:MAG: Rrf2 family transcriptional regulator [Eubacteriales bacterium]